MAIPVTFTIFGGTGDLTKRKLVPAFARLLEENQISKGSTIIGTGRSKHTDKTYKAHLLSGQSQKVKSQITKLNIKYFQANVTDLTGLDSLISSIEKSACNRLFYLATSFTLFGTITEELKRLNLHNAKTDNFTRVVFEKPFGKDLKTHNQFESNLSKVFKEDQIFRIDHYLGKETISNLNTLKFENPMFEAVLNNKHVEKIEFIVDEDLTVGKRASFYNEFGAIKDMIQSHLLQVLSLILMDRPKKFQPNYIHKEKVKALKNLKILPAKNHLLGQYASYKYELKNTNLKDIGTETFAKIALKSTSKKWKNIPITLRTGKALPRKYGKIIITLKHESNKGCLPNIIEVNIQPSQDINLHLNIGHENACERVSLNFCHDCQFGPNSADGYEKMIKDILKGDSTLFTSVDENRASWKIVEQIEKMKPKIKTITYKDNTDPEKN